MKIFKANLRAHDYSSKIYNCVNTVSRNTCILHIDRYMVDVCISPQVVDYNLLYFQVCLVKYDGTAEHTTLNISHEIVAIAAYSIYIIHPDKSTTFLHRY